MMTVAAVGADRLTYELAREIIGNRGWALPLPPVMPEKVRAARGS